MAGIGRLEDGDVELVHLQHRLHYPLSFRGVAIAKQLGNMVGTICQEMP